MPRDHEHRPDEEVLSTRAAAEAHRLIDMCRKKGIVKAAGAARGRKLTLRPWAAAGPARGALLRRGSAILHMLGGSTLGETQQNLLQIYSVGVPARASEGPHHQSS